MRIDFLGPVEAIVALDIQNPASPETAIPAEDWRIVQWICREDTCPSNVRTAFFFLCLHLYEGMQAWYAQNAKEAADGNAYREEAARYFLVTKVKENVDALVGRGEHGGMNIDSFARACRSDYIETVGVPDINDER